MYVSIYIYIYPDSAGPQARDTKKTQQGTKSSKLCRLPGPPFEAKSTAETRKAPPGRVISTLWDSLSQATRDDLVRAGLRAPDVEVQDPLTKVVDAHRAALPPDVQEVMKELETSPGLRTGCALCPSGSWRCRCKLMSSRRSSQRYEEIKLEAQRDVDAAKESVAQITQEKPVEEDAEEKPDGDGQAKDMELNQSEQFKKMCQNTGLTLESWYVQRLKDIAKSNPFNLSIRPCRGPPTQADTPKPRSRSPKPVSSD